VKAPLPNATLRNKLANYRELVQYTDRISEKYFARLSSSQGVETESDQSRKDDDEENKEEKRVSSRAHLLTPVAVAACAMLGYAYVSGLMQKVLRMG
jgi:hypothetical protein